MAKGTKYSMIQYEFRVFYRAIHNIRVVSSRWSWRVHRGRRGKGRRVNCVSWNAKTRTANVRDEIERGSRNGRRLNSNERVRTRRVGRFGWDRIPNLKSKKKRRTEPDGENETKSIFKNIFRFPGPSCPLPPPKRMRRRNRRRRYERRTEKIRGNRRAKKTKKMRLPCLVVAELIGEHVSGI